MCFTRTNGMICRASVLCSRKRPKLIAPSCTLLPQYQIHHRMNHISIEHIQIEFISSIHLNPYFSRKIAGTEVERYLAVISPSALRTSAPPCDQACRGLLMALGGGTTAETQKKRAQRQQHRTRGRGELGDVRHFVQARRPRIYRRSTEGSGTGANFFGGGGGMVEMKWGKKWARAQREIQGGGWVFTRERGR
jgi:hypothetical protein